MYAQYAHNLKNERRIQMSTEEKDLKAVTAEETEETKETEENNETGEPKEKAAPKKKKLLNAQRIEIITAVFLGITALLTAWATWIGSLHGGNQATNYTRSNNIASEGNSAYNSAMQLYLSDLMTWNTAIDYQLDAQVAKMKGSNDEAAIYEEKMKAFMSQNCSQIMLDAINQMDENMMSPFEVEGTTEKYFEEANSLIAQSQELLKEGQRDNKNGDSYNLVNVIYSVVLFLLGIIGVFKNLPNRKVVLCIAIAGVVLATIYMCTIPLPTGFSLLSFFGIGG